MSLNVRPEYDIEAWNSYVERSDGTNALHRYEALDVLADHADAELHPLVGFNGEEPIGLLPLFETSRGPFTTVSSPPAFIDTLQLGPAMLNLEKMKRRRAERRQRQFVDECLAWVDGWLSPDQVHIRTDPRFPDIRAFSWAGFDAKPYYTYFVDIDRDEEEILADFSSDARSNVRNADESGFEITVGDHADLQAIVEQVKARHEEQGAPIRIEADTVLDLYDALPEGVLRPYVCRVDGDYASGMVTLEHGDIIYRWKGGAKTGADAPSSDVLDWHIMQDARERGLKYYDLVGANMPRLCDYKSKFGPEVRTYYVLERRTSAMDAAVVAQRTAKRAAKGALRYVR